MRNAKLLCGTAPRRRLRGWARSAGMSMGDTAARDDDASGRLDTLAAAARASAEDGFPPVHKWEPPYCDDIGLEIRRDGEWRHQGAPILRQPLVAVFSRILRKDDDGRHYLVTPVEKVLVRVAIAPFMAVRVDAVEGRDEDEDNYKDPGEAGRRLFVTTNVGDVFELGPGHRVWVETDPETGAPIPLARVRARLDALFTRPAFFELVELAEERETADGPQLGVAAGGAFFPLAAPGAHQP